MDYPKFPNWAILLWCSLLYSRSAFICGHIVSGISAEKQYRPQMNADERR